MTCCSYPNLGSSLSTQIVEKIEQISEVIDFLFKTVFIPLLLQKSNRTEMPPPEKKNIPQFRNILCGLKTE